MFLEKIHTEGLAHLSYILGDGIEAAVIDPRVDCTIYLDIARREGVRITHIFETHRNEDFVVGSLELARQTGAEIHHGEALAFAYGKSTREGDSFQFGNLEFRILATPGHTLESLSFVLIDKEFSDDPIVVFTGDALFIGDVGRTDFYPDRKEEMAGMLYDSIVEKILPLGDQVLLYPAHGAGSVCGSGMAAREFSTLGYERLHNPALQVKNKSQFIDRKIQEQPQYPPYFKTMEEINLEGCLLSCGIPTPWPVDADDFADRSEAGMLILDVRSPESFAGAFIPGSLAIPLDMLAGYAGWFLPYDQDIGLVLSSSEELEMAVLSLLRLGYQRITCHLENGLHEWEISGREFDRIPAIHAGELKNRLDRGEDFTILDVRTPQEFQQGIIRNATTIFLGELPDRLGEIPPNRPVTTFCGSGRRAIIAASILKANGFEQVEDSLGSMAACRKVGCDICQPDNE